MSAGAAARVALGSLALCAPLDGASFRQPDPHGAVGNAWCWGDETVQLPPRWDCCSRGSACFHAGGTTRAGPVIGEYSAVFAREKCCVRKRNRSSFYGFVNPRNHLVETWDGTTSTGQVLEHFTADLPGGHGAPALRTFVHSDAEVPQQLAWELARFEARRSEYSAVYEGRRSQYRHGHHPCHSQFEVFGSAVFNVDQLLLQVFSVLGWDDSPRSRFVNIGANNGIDEDPLAALLRKWRNTWAVAAEMDPKLCEEHRNNLPHVHVFCGPATPANAWEVLDPWLPADELSDADAAGRRVLHVNVLKVDIDSYDCSLIETYLRGAWSNRAGAVLRMLPQLILTEVNDAVPPPVQQALLFSPSLADVNLEHAECAGNIPLAGCSLSYQVAHFARFGYSLILYAQAGAVFAHESVMQELARNGIKGPVDEFECYWHAPLAAQCASGRQIRRWFHETEGPRTAWDLVAEVTGHLKALERHFGLPAMPMILEV